MAAARGKLLDFVNTSDSETVDKHLETLLETTVTQTSITQERDTA